MKIRVLSGIILVIITAIPLLCGGLPLLIISLLLSIGGMYELYKLEKIEKSILAFLSYAFSIMYYAFVYFKLDKYLLSVIVLAFLVFMLIYVLSFPKFKASQVMITVFGLIYLTVMLSYIYKVRVLSNGIYIVWLIFITSWVNDTFAYFSGMAFGRGGKHRMAPVLSPKKTMEGFFGGIIISGIVGAIYGLCIADKLSSINNAPIIFAIVCVGGAAISVIGDLTASGIKRNYGIKDYSNLIPGHGGILDRYDSVIFTAPVVFYLVEIWNLL